MLLEGMMEEREKEPTGSNSERLRRRLGPDSLAERARLDRFGATLGRSNDGRVSAGCNEGDLPGDRQGRLTALW